MGNSHAADNMSRLARQHAGAKHLIPIFDAVRDHGCSYRMVTNTGARVALPSASPSIDIIGDDMHEALGPTAFRKSELKRIFRKARRYAVISSGIDARVYAGVSVIAAVERENVVLVETRPRFEADWIDCIRKYSMVGDSAGILVCTVLPEDTVH